MCDIEFKNVSFSFGSRKILDNISFKIKQGDFVSILGKNGSGKSVLVQHINGLLLPNSGDVFVDNVNTKCKSRIYDIRQKIGFMFQDPDNQIVAGTVEEDIAFGLSNLGVERTIMRRKVDEILQKLDIYKYRMCDVNKLSGGIKQKLILAGMLVMNAECFVLDEPTSMLDSESCQNIMRDLIKLNKEENKTLILITHHLDEAKLADRIFLLESGKICENKNELIDRYFVANYDFSSIENCEKKVINNDVILETKNLYFRYTKKDPYVIENLNIKIHKGEILEITGKNGSGKSTFVHILKGILEKTSGQIFFCGKNASRKILNKNVGIVFQIPDNQLFEETVLKDVSFGPRNMGLSKEKATQRAIEALNIVGFNEKFFNYSPFMLSGGMKRLVSIASTIAMNPEILIFDEPTACLDFYENEKFLNLIVKLNRKYDKTIIIIHHKNDKEYFSFKSNFVTSTLRF